MRAHGDARYYFPSGTKMVFYQESAPTGWTIDTTNTDSALRVVNTTTVNITSTDAIDDTIFYRIKTVSGDTDFTAIGAASNAVGVIFKPTQGIDSFTGAGVLTIGGGGMPGGLTGFSSAFSHSHGDNFSSSGQSLTVSQMPKHYHQMRGPNGVTAPQNDTGYSGGGFGYGGGTYGDPTQDYGTWSAGGTASSGSESTGTSTGDSHSHSFSGSVSTASISPKYVDVIICIKS
jgi:hypothetical protein